MPMGPSLAAALALALAVAVAAFTVAVRERRRYRELAARLTEGGAAAPVDPGAAADRPAGPGRLQPTAEGAAPAPRAGNAAGGRLAVIAAAEPAEPASPGADSGARRAFVGIARRVQALVHQQLRELREMEERHGGDPAVFGDLLRVDHGTALIGRLADSLVVLGGQSPGRRWSEPVGMLGVFRGAMSRIIDYRRVEIGATPEVAVVGPAVEPVVHALAELLDNATRYSPPDSCVRLTARPERGRILIEVEDAGVGLGREAALRVARVLAAASDGPDLDDLGRSPRLGLAVVGRLARATG